MNTTLLSRLLQKRAEEFDFQAELAKIPGIPPEGGWAAHRKQQEFEEALRERQERDPQFQIKVEGPETTTSNPPTPTTPAPKR